MSGVATRLATGASSGAIALRNSAQKSMAFSPSVTETAPRVRSLHRDLLRSVPWVKRAFGVSMPEAKMRSLLTSAFKEKQNTTDVTTINRLIVQGRMELEEALMLWKGPSHVTNWFENAEDALKKKAVPKAAFLDDFFSGKS